MSLRHASFAIVAATAFFAAQPAWSAAVPADGELDFTVLRDGEEIGTHVLTFDVDPSGTVDVDIATDVAVSMMFVTVYSFEHEGHEHWEGGRLMELRSETDDDGEEHKLIVVSDGGVYNVSDNGLATQRPATLLPASLWNDGIVAAPQTTLLNTLDGSAMAVTVEDLGTETVTGENGAVQAHHYRLSGDLQRELWYDPDGVLVKIRFSAEDGSDIQYVLR